MIKELVKNATPLLKEFAKEHYEALVHHDLIDKIKEACHKECGMTIHQMFMRKNIGWGCRFTNNLFDVENSTGGYDYWDEYDDEISSTLCILSRYDQCYGQINRAINNHFRDHVVDSYKGSFDMYKVKQNLSNNNYYIAEVLVGRADAKLGSKMHDLKRKMEHLINIQFKQVIIDYMDELGLKSTEAYE